MNINAKGYKVINTDRDGIQYELLLEKDGVERLLSIFCSGTLKKVWRVNDGDNDFLFDGLYSLARQIITGLFLEGKVKGLEDIFPLDFDTYNSPRDIPCFSFPLPDTITIANDTKNESFCNLASRIDVSPLEAKVSSIRFGIAEARDHINSFIKEKYGFKFFYIAAERAIVDMYLPCVSKEEYTTRLLAIRNLISWLNTKELAKTLKNPEIKLDGAINYLEKFLNQKYPNYNKKIIANLRNINWVCLSYPTHADSSRIISGCKNLGLKWPISDYRGSWEVILEAYSESLNLLLQNINNSE